MQIRCYPGIPVRIFIRNGKVIWSKVDDAMVDLTLENSEGLLHHMRAVFVPHGALNPIERRPADASEAGAAAALEVAAEYVNEGPDWREFRCIDPSQFREALGSP